jgi:hypothetical protein
MVHFFDGIYEKSLMDLGFGAFSEEIVVSRNEDILGGFRKREDVFYETTNAVFLQTSSLAQLIITPNEPSLNSNLIASSSLPTSSSITGPLKYTCLIDTTYQYNLSFTDKIPSQLSVSLLSTSPTGVVFSLLSPYNFWLLVSGSRVPSLNRSGFIAFKPS